MSRIIPPQGQDAMDRFMHGLVITMVGMGGTLLSLCFIVFVVRLLKRLVPYREADEPKEKEVA
jgi:Na+-transporting methylmalonyl-CoA/oxaloacetate decarboxylase gamma subunit